MNANHPTSAPVARRAAQAHAAQVVFLFVLLAGCVVPGSLRLWLHLTPNTILATSNVGTFVTASTGDDATDVRTTMGTIAVAGTLSALRGSPLVIQRSTQHGTELCVVRKPESCVSLAGPWSGSMQAVPGLRHGIDFYAHGITRSFLRFWLVLGVITTLMCGIGAAAVTMDTASEPDDA